MKPNPCRRCGSEPSLIKNIVGVFVYCNRCSRRRTWQDYLLEDWNAMNPLPQSDRLGPMPVDEAEFAKGIAKQADALRPSDCPVESQEPVEQTCGNCYFYRAQFCRRYAPVAMTREADTNFTQPMVEAAWPFVSEVSWCGEWRAK